MLLNVTYCHKYHLKPRPFHKIHLLTRIFLKVCMTKSGTHCIYYIGIHTYTFQYFKTKILFSIYILVLYLNPTHFTAGRFIPLQALKFRSFIQIEKLPLQLIIKKLKSITLWKNKILFVEVDLLPSKYFNHQLIGTFKPTFK